MKHRIKYVIAGLLILMGLWLAHADAKVMFLITRGAYIAAGIINYNPTAPFISGASEVSRRDSNGNSLDASAGNILQVGSTFYLYGHADTCGYAPGAAGSPWCGIRVYSSTDLENWVDNGYLFDGSVTLWQNNCAASAGGYKGCYGPKMLYNAANNNYVLWFFGQISQSSTQNSMFVFTCTSPNGGATPATPGTGCTQQSNATFPTLLPEQPSFYAEPGGNAYLAYTDLATGNLYHVMVMQLNSSYTNTTGSAVDTGLLGEGNFIFERNGTTYVGAGSEGCAFCVNATLSYVSAPSPLGTYAAPINIAPSSCAGQPRDVAVVTGNNITSYVYMVDQFINGAANQAEDNSYFETLQFTATGAIVRVCNPFQLTNYVQGLNNSALQIPPGGAVDQTDVSPPAFTDTCDLSATLFRMQVIIPTKSVIKSVSMPLQAANPSCFFFTGPCPQANGSLVVSLVTLDGSLNPVTTLASQTINPSSLKWRNRWTNISFGGITVTPGTSYGIILGTTGLTQGCYGTSISPSNTPNNQRPYLPGFQRVSVDGGSTWGNTGGSIMFSTY